MVKVTNILIINLIKMAEIRLLQKSCWEENINFKSYDVIFSVFLVRRVEVKNLSKELNIYLREFITCWFPIH